MRPRADDPPGAPHRARGGRLAAMLGAALACTGCAGPGRLLDFPGQVKADAQKMRERPSDNPVRNETDFTHALRCMDRLFVVHGVREVSVLADEIDDRTGKVKAGARDMLASAVSEMTRRSRAVQLVVFSSRDELTAFLEKAQRSSPYERVPVYTAKGSISQLDESVVRKQADGALSLPWFGAGVARSSSVSVLGVDLNVIRSDTFMLEPGVSTRNMVTILRDGQGADGEAHIKKFNLNFSFALSKSEGQSQALRRLIELASIELLGRLTRVPYWSCIGGHARDRLVVDEINDWWEAMAREPVLLVSYLQRQMTARQLYSGAVDGLATPALLRSVKAYQRALGMAADASLDAEFLHRYLAADHAQIQPKAVAALADATPEVVAPQAGVGAGPGATPPATVAPVALRNDTLTVQVTGGRGAEQAFRQGDAYGIEVSVSRDAHVYCYRVAAQSIALVYPERGRAPVELRVGSRARFAVTPIVANRGPRGDAESVACFGSRSMIDAATARRLERAAGIDALVGDFRRLSGGEFGWGRFDATPH